MQGTTHRIIGVAAGLALMQGTGMPFAKNPLESGIFLSLTVLGSMLPDADVPQSTIGQRLFLLMFPFYILRAVAGILGFIIKPLKVLAQGMAHRKVFHTPFFWLLLGMALYFSPVPWKYVFPVLLGVASHLLCDFPTGGIPLLFPLSLKSVRLPLNFKTGGYFEFLVAGAGLSMIFLLCGRKLLFLIGGLI